MSIDMPDRKILRKVATITRPAIGFFDVKKNFMSREINGCFNSKFEQAFLGDYSRIEDPVTETELRIYQIIDDSDDRPIMAEDSNEEAAETIPTQLDDISIIVSLGGEEATEITLGRISEMVEAQSQGQDGVLLVDKHLNNSYVRNTEGTLYVVSYWYCNNHHWEFMANKASNLVWATSLQIISH